MNKLLPIFLVAFAASFLSSCSTVTRGTTQKVTVNSNVPGTLVTVTRTDKPISGKDAKKNAAYYREVESKPALQSTAPVILELSRKGKYVITGTKKGYKKTTALVKGKVSGGGAAGMAGNALVGGIIGIGVDAATGASLDLSPNPVALEMTR